LNVGSFELKATDLGGRIGLFETKTSKFETPALLPVIHPTRQLIPCSEIRGMGYEAVMTNAYTTYRRAIDRADQGIHKIIGFDGSIMTDSGGYQVLEFGSVEIDPQSMAKFEERIGSDIAIILDKPTGLNVTEKFARKTVLATLESAKKTKESIVRDDIVWTLPIQGGKYLGLVKKSAKESAKLDYGCYALGSPVEIMEDYDFPLLVEMIRASKANIPDNRPFHLFGAGHPLTLPLAIALGCDMFDSASYMLYSRNDRYISSTGTIRAEQLEYLPCICPICSKTNARELRSLSKDERTSSLARHNLWTLRQVIQETKQAIWEGRLWEFVRARCSAHPAALSAFKLATSSSSSFLEVGTPDLKERGLFVSDDHDLSRPEIARHLQKKRRVNFHSKHHLVIVPETKTKPFLTSDIFNELIRIVDPKRTMICYASSIFGLVPSEISDIFPVSQITGSAEQYPEKDFILDSKNWQRIDILVKPSDRNIKRLEDQIKRRRKTKLLISTSYRSLKKKLAQV
jgi:7-cyano-7-deazaguanine tRNA-ribosyltransferase